jgi:hypothetical protein
VPRSGEDHGDEAVGEGAGCRGQEPVDRRGGPPDAPLQHLDMVVANFDIAV